jgi:hypothetical protein
MNRDKIILDLCGGTGSWSKPYKEAGYDVILVTLPETDIRTYIPPENVYGILAAPPCTEFSKAKQFHGKGNYTHDFVKGLETVSACMRIILTCNPKFWALENPSSGFLKRWLYDPKYIFEPWEFGDDYQKSTALWGNFNDPIKTVFKKPDGMIKFSMLKSKDIVPEYFGVYTRKVRRSMTPQGFAQAFFKANK